MNADLVNISGKLTKLEDSRSDKVKMATYRSYIQAAGGFCIFMVVLLLILITLSAQSFTNYWLSVGLKAGSGVSVERESHSGGECR